MHAHSESCFSGDTIFQPTFPNNRHTHTHTRSTETPRTTIFSQCSAREGGFRETKSTAHGETNGRHSERLTNTRTLDRQLVRSARRRRRRDTTHSDSRSTSRCSRSVPKARELSERSLHDGDLVFGAAATCDGSVVHVFRIRIEFPGMCGCVCVCSMSANMFIKSSCLVFCFLHKR